MMVIFRDSNGSLLLLRENTKTLKMLFLKLEFQRDQESRLRDLETAWEGQKPEIAKLKDHNAKLERDLTNALNDLKARAQWECKVTVVQAR